MERPNIASGLKTEMVELKTAEGTTFYAHREILESQCKPSAHNWWVHFRTPTVERFLEYVYQGDYTPEMAEVAEADPVMPTSTAGDEYTEMEGYGLTGDRPASPGLDYEKVFLAHAELYILSRSQEAKSLATLSTLRLREALESAAVKPVSPSFADNMNVLLRYIYDNDRYISMIGRTALRELQVLVSEFSVLNIEEIVPKNPNLIKDGGELVLDLVGGTVKRLTELQRLCAQHESTQWGSGVIVTCS